MAEIDNAQATKLRTWRLDHGLRLEEVAALTGISVAMLSRAERGQRSFAPLTKVRIARRLGARVEALFEIEPIEESDEQLAVRDLVGVAKGR